jgi:hypothetical protein
MDMIILEALDIVAAINHVSRKSGQLVTVSGPKTAKALRVVCAHWFLVERGHVTPDLRGVPAWLSYEMKIYRLGKALGLVMKKLDLWKGKGDVMDAAASIMRKRDYGRGRQSFALTIGEHGGEAYGENLAAALRDDEIGGYAVKALLEGGHGGYASEVRTFGERSDVVWVQNAAKRYVERFEANEAPAISTVTPKLSAAAARPPNARVTRFKIA